MWHHYSKSYIKNNRTSGASIMAAAFIATFFLSLLCTLAYNLWKYEIEKIVLDEGDWQARIIAEINEQDMSAIHNFSNVKKAVVNKELSEKNKTVIDIYFYDAGEIYKDVPLILERLSLDDDSAVYHELLLSRYFIHNPQDETPPLLMAFYSGVLLIVSLSLILIIRNSFELSMKARIHQFGILSGIGATPKQIRLCLMQEAAVLCTVPVISGILFGIAASFGIMQAINIFAADVSGRHEAVFKYHPYVFFITFAAAALTVSLSAWLPAKKLSKIPPLQAIRNPGNFKLKKRKNSRVLSLLFGIEGELAGNALNAQKKALRICSVSLLLSFLAFSIMLCFTTLSDISTRFTYFERYQNDWDIMVTVKNTAIEDFGQTENLYSISQVRDITLYQKTEETTFISDNRQSEELISLGGLEAVAENYSENGRFKVKAPVIIMDNKSFLNYCSEIGISPSLEGAIILNRIWDSVNSNFRYKEYVPFVNENVKTSVLHSANEDNRKVEIPILSYTQKTPVLREEYENYALVHFIPLSVWKSLSEQSNNKEADSYIRILADENIVPEDLNALEKSVIGLIKADYETESENRIQEKISNEKMIDGSKMIFGAFCVLLAAIGIADIFFNTLGFLRQRKREFAQYMSVGLTPKKMRKIFAIEAFVIAGRPLLITLPLTVVLVQLMINASFLDPAVFWSEAPIIPIIVFAMSIVIFVALAYYIGGKRLLKCNLNEALRDDTLTP